MECHEEQGLSLEIDRLLSSLSDCNDRMSHCVASPGTSSRTANTALLQRYREIYFDFKREFDETASAIQKKRESAELFRGAVLRGYRENTATKGGGHSSGNEDGSLMSHLYREQDALGSSLRSAGSVIGQAGAVRDVLLSQRRSILVSDRHQSKNPASRLPGGHSDGRRV